MLINLIHKLVALAHLILKLIDYSADIVREILKVQPQFALKADKNGCVALHYACERRQLEITRLLLEFAARSAKKFNKNAMITGIGAHF